MPIEGLHTETGPGVLEAAIKRRRGARSRRQGGSVQDLHQGARAAARLDGDLHGQMVADWPGQRGHLHMSLLDPERQAAFSTMRASRTRRCRDRCAGSSAASRRSCRSCSPWSPRPSTAIAGSSPASGRRPKRRWGIENRTCALRVIRGSPKSQRVEYRIAAADINPYVALAAAIGSGLGASRTRSSPTRPIEGNAYAQEVSAGARLAAHTVGGRRSG